MTRDVLKAADGATVYVDRGESAVVRAQFYNMDGDALNKASIVTLTATLTDEESGAIINGRNGQDVLDANDGTVSAAGWLTLKLQPKDNIVCGAQLDEIEHHILVVKWTWVDDDGDTQTGKKQWIIQLLPTSR